MGIGSSLERGFLSRQVWVGGDSMLVYDSSKVCKRIPSKRLDLMWRVVYGLKAEFCNEKDMPSSSSRICDKRMWVKSQDRL
ncbi:uncharacterized protein L203_105285 [Cryptococcus depauperatus CBS 7841]|uniref:Uncharacterized protein n=1 Tax=Cryptococcus depauperatus CBS 7841 TaxID=1295531 RepID=A0AAJ8JX50_9TREE